MLATIVDTTITMILVFWVPENRIKTSGWRLERQLSGMQFSGAVWVYFKNFMLRKISNPSQSGENGKMNLNVFTYHPASTTIYGQSCFIYTQLPSSSLFRNNLRLFRRKSMMHIILFVNVSVCISKCKDLNNPTNNSYQSSKLTVRL